LGQQPTLEQYYPELVRETAFNTTAAKNAPESTTRVLFWYHPDYLGNVDLVTERDGKTYEFFTYNPWGEEMHQYNANTFSFSSPYRFNSKEKDPETGLHYYGARYYQSKLSMWLSVDPKAHWYSGHSPYNFSLNNPVMMVDPDGQWVNGAGFFRNLFNSDEKIKAQDEADKHIGGDAFKHDGGWRAIWPTYEHQQECKSHTTISTSNFKDFHKRNDKIKKDIIADMGSRLHPSSTKNDLKTLSKNMQYVGDNTALAGYGAAVIGAPIAGVGAVPGLSVAGAGNIVAVLGSALEIGIDLYDGNDADAYIGIGVETGAIILDASIDRMLPGPTPDMTPQMRSALKTGNDLFREGWGVKYSIITNQIRK
jgi:RHS repeat-associated protein